jgi:hypothetical protein
MKDRSMSSPVRIAGFVLITALVSGLIVPFSAEGANGVSAKIPFDPNPKHWFAKPQSQKQWEQSQTQKAKDSEAKQQAKKEKERLKEEAQQQKAEAKKLAAEQSQQAKALKKQKRNKGASSENKVASASPASAPDSAPNTNPNAILPPDKSTLERDCEPLRLKIVALNQQNRAAKAATFVERRKLMKAHETCLFEFSQKEIRYIKNFQFANKNNPAAEPIPGKTATPVPKGATLRINNPSTQPKIEEKNTDLAPLKP